MDTIYNLKPLRSESSAQLGAFVDKIGSSVAALKALNLENLGEFILFYLAQLKLDDNSKRLFELSLDPKEIPTFDKLLIFLKIRLNFSLDLVILQILVLMVKICWLLLRNHLIFTLFM